MTSVADLINESLTPIKLRILVFGPQVETLSTNERTLNLQNKRMEIRAALEGLGHEVKYAEDVVDSSIEGPAVNPFFQEMVIMEDFDFIVTLVDSPGSNIETGVIASKANLARKASLYIDQNYLDGLAGQACKFVEQLGGHLHAFTYPEDLTDCHLLGHVKNRASTIQMWKYLV